MEDFKTIIIVLEFIFGTGSLAGLIKLLNVVSKKKRKQWHDLIKKACEESNEKLEISINNLTEDVSHIKDEQKKLKKDIDLQDASTVRHRILSFDLLIRQSKSKHPDIFNFKNIIKDINKYDKYKQKYPELNGEANNAISHIYAKYDEWYGGENEL